MNEKIKCVKSTRSTPIFGVTTAIIMLFVIVGVVGSTIYLNSVIDKISKVSLMTQYYWNVKPPDKKTLWKAVNAIVEETGTREKVLQQPELKYKKDCEPLRPCPTNALTVVDYEHSKPTLLATDEVELNDFFVVSSRIDKMPPAKTPAGAGKTALIRYTAKIEADINRLNFTREVEFKTKSRSSDFIRKRESAEVEVTLKWNPKTSEWETP